MQMPYVVATIIIVVGMLAYAFGESMARITVAVIMALCSCAILALVYVAAMDVNRQIYAKPQSAVRYGAPR